ncbi:MAG: ABC transporter substrate-binding protein [Planctomycetes bacterium]|nr:ABC transporter substrate-binding protein [Planctomycetota bacterium]
MDAKGKIIYALILFGIVIWGVAVLLGCEPEQKLAVNAGYFPDIVHAQALIGRANGSFSGALSSQCIIDWKVFNAGPSAIEALFAGEIDIAYIGPNPAINGFIKSKGRSLKIIAGASSGGAGLVVRKDSGITKIEDFHNKKIATPQLGNTQDVACRYWFQKQGLLSKEKGGDLQVIPIANPDQLSLMVKKEIDAAWTKEPWVARLIKEANGRLYMDERDIWENGEFVTAHVIVSTKFLEAHRDLVKEWVRVHVDLTDWINKNNQEAKKIINAEIKKLTGHPLAEGVLDDAFTRVKITHDPISKSLLKSAAWAYEIGFLGKEQPALDGIYDLSILDEVLKERQN